MALLESVVAEGEKASSLWQIVVHESQRVYSLWLILWLVLVVAAVRARGRAVMQAERHRIRTATILVVTHLVVLLVTAVLKFATDVVWRDFQLVSLVVATLAAVQLTSILLFGVTLPRLRLVAPIILRDVITGVAAIVASLAVATRAGFDWTGVLATSAVITAVIGFSLQDLLGNVAGGLTLQMDESIQVGDWIKLGDVVGKVIDIRWRYTAVETRNWETVYIPNSQMTKGQVIALGKRTDQPCQLRRWVWFNVDFRYAPTDVITIVTRALHDAALDNVAESPAPNCVLMDLTESYGKYAVRYWLTDLTVDDPTDSSVRTRIYYALRRANIPLSMPAFAAFVTNDTTERKTHKQAQEHERRLRALKQIGLFNRLPDGVLAHLADSLVAAPFAAGEIMVHKGEEAHWLYMIVNGEASVRSGNGDDQSRETARLTHGSFFGEMSLLTGEPREATVVALTDVDCYRLEQASACEVLTRRPEFAEYIAEVMARRHVQDAHAQSPLDRKTEAEQVHAAKLDLLHRIRAFFELEDVDSPERAKGA